MHAAVPLSCGSTPRRATVEERIGPKRFRRVCSIVCEALRPTTALLVLITVLALPALAYSEPPDPTWVSGLWDDDDFDNVIEAVTNTLVWHHTSPPVIVHVKPTASLPLLPCELGKPVLRALHWPETRAPPDA